MGRFFDYPKEAPIWETALENVNLKLYNLNLSVYNFIYGFGFFVVVVYFSVFFNTTLSEGKVNLWVLHKNNLCF